VLPELHRTWKRHMAQSDRATTETDCNGMRKTCTSFGTGTPTRGVTRDAKISSLKSRRRASGRGSSCVQAHSPRLEASRPHVSALLWHSILSTRKPSLEHKRKKAQKKTGRAGILLLGLLLLFVLLELLALRLDDGSCDAVKITLSILEKGVSYEHENNEWKKEIETNLRNAAATVCAEFQNADLLERLADLYTRNKSVLRSYAPQLARLTFRWTFVLATPWWLGLLPLRFLPPWSLASAPMPTALRR